jgi:cellulose synthase/poly-beta-1,6-N-acetylglucosamine synthase-like glycosyltransferase/phosphoglycerol transferase MdoB-like AlkP superfamily enzyme
MWKLVLYDLFSYGILIYSVTLLASYIFIGFYSIGETRKHLRKSSFTDYNLLASSNFAPSVSILAPAYNEGANIIENVRSLLSIHYNHLELIVINDGSKDDSMQKLIDAYDLEVVDFLYHEHIPAKKVKAVYKSRNTVYKKLVVIDKVNGGKADALNTGINLASNQYLVCIDVDCILEQDALLKLVKPFIEETDKRVIATGGVVRIANSCVIQNGRLLDVNLSKDFLPRVQTLEYIRAFLLGRMAWSRLNGLLLISGAFGAFDREIVIKAGGYDHKTVGEDMELVVRTRRYMEEHGIPYKVAYIPDPLCWTEAPASYKILGRQRNRWTRGTIETLKIHRVLFMNPKYGLLGLISYPYWFFFEFLAPIIEFIGMVGFIFFSFSGMVNWTFFLALLGFVLTFGWLYSIFAILMEVLTYNQYKKKGDLAKLIFTAMLEPFLFHPFLIWSAIRGNIDLIRKKNSWGEMTRQGFHLQPGMVPEKRSFISRVQAGLFSFLPVATGWLLMLLLLRVADFMYNGMLHQYPGDPAFVLSVSVLNDLLFFIKAGFVLGLIHTAVSLFNSRLANTVTITFSILLTLVSLSLMQYFSLSFVPLGADLYGYTLSDIRQTIGASGGLNGSSALVIAGVILGLLAIYKWIAPRIYNIARWLQLGVVFLALSWTLAGMFLAGNLTIRDEYAGNLAKNKLSYFVAASYEHFFSAEKTQPVVAKTIPQGLEYIDEANYPFLHKDNTPDVLTPFFNKGKTAPDIVVLIVEGLGRAFTNERAYLGSFTPYLDSLSHHSLYWENFLSNGGRTFAVLPSVLGSLPFGKNGFSETGANMPNHLSMMSLLKSNGYHTSFYYGGDAEFDNMAHFLRRQQVDAIHDTRSFPADYQRLPESRGFSWGYGDKELYRHVLQTKDAQAFKGKPSLQVILTVATHNPFLINEQAKYLDRFEQQMTVLGLSDDEKNTYRSYDHQYASILYADDAIRTFMEEYSKRPGFRNTIFLITGDHRMPEIPMATTLDRYHVPLLIYSPLLKRATKFESVSSHADIAPTLLKFLASNYNIKQPGQASWIGRGLDTAHEFRNRHTIPLMQTKTDLVDYVADGYHLHGNELFKLQTGMGEEPVEDPERKAKVMESFQAFKQKNNQITEGKPMLPDSLYQAFFPK